ncbi:MAG: tRNA (adenosine(37)-N6)-threonylcarbamoyltransferase complex ATPase subunit type 1 TsaE [Mojavia pulchra JT2-VF2]|jgi:tRNA threonylcarbamoyladenosine biosynthesis protein TsaE|uniref:tRNA threonylcarbamoyladenosine biosynthesis protein TsaE n=1 Tax=Mojavia pulchra JT2-VF2 TaxID=287848 RepID=A0A951Q1L5_9NOST|nr:tRNA (adenosine(37)-N6)-threonylcarbamoyltransferase complex ATPase subunit type 1 TsaE [Mojavia pulchra JT2-VF2]
MVDEFKIEETGRSHLNFTKKIVLADAEATFNLGIAFGQSLTVGSVILLEGDLGAGKTTLVQGIGKGLGITESIVSPTFTLINEYTQGRLPLYHLDLYRLESPEVATLNLETYWEGFEVTPGIVAIEWAERMPYKPSSYISVYLTYGNEGDRQAEITLCNCALSEVIATL